jgi:hypothetical protein
MQAYKKKLSAIITKILLMLQKAIVHMPAENTERDQLDQQDHSIVTTSTTRAVAEISRTILL